MTLTPCVTRPSRLAARSAAAPFAVALTLSALLGGHLGAWAAEDKPVYKCPGNLYTDALSAREAQEKGCRTLDGAPVTVIQSMPRSTSGAGVRPAGADRVGADDQKARDADARLILDAELRKEEDALATLQKEYNGGQPERRGEERNFQKYQDRVAELKAAITRKESDVAALKRELAKLGAGK